MFRNMKTNVKVKAAPVHTHEGAVAANIPVKAQLRRTVLACLLWETEFYESGVSIAARIAALVQASKPDDVAALAIEAREQQHLRHVPLLLLRELARHPKLPDKLLSTTLARVIQRADELTEFLAIYWKSEGGKRPLTKQMKRGLAWALRRFNEYELAKYSRDSAVTIRDVLFLCHPKPKDDAQAALWKRLAQNELKTPDTWEVALSGGADKKQTFERLIREGKLGYFALIRNLRNMEQAGCDRALVSAAILARKGGADKVLPFRFIAAAKAAMRYETALDTAMLANMEAMPKLAGTTVILVDVSGSMDCALSAKSDLQRVDAAAGVAMIARSVCEAVRVFAFSDNVAEVPPRNGMALKDAIQKSMPHGGTNLIGAVQLINALVYDRIIVITDEQAGVFGTQSTMPPPRAGAKGYLINVASNKNGVGYGPWTHIDGWSESVIRFIVESEQPLKGED
jgi:hypothetical protein